VHFFALPVSESHVCKYYLSEKADSKETEQAMEPHKRMLLGGGTMSGTDCRR